MIELSSLTIYDHPLAVVIGVILPLLGALQHRSNLEEDDDRFTSWQKIATYLSNSAFLCLLCLIGLAVWWYAGRTFNDLGLTVLPKRYDWGLLLASLFLISYAFDTWKQLTPRILPATKARWKRDTPFMPENAREIWHSLVLVVTASISEEILYRGFLISYTAYFTGNSTLGLAAAVVIPAVVFGFCHFYQGKRSVFKIIVLASVFGAIFVVTGSLWIPIALHFIVDLIGMLLGLKLLRPEKVSEVNSRKVN